MSNKRVKTRLKSKNFLIGDSAEFLPKNVLLTEIDMLRRVAFEREKEPRTNLKDLIGCPECQNYKDSKGKLR